MSVLLFNNYIHKAVIRSFLVTVLRNESTIHTKIFNMVFSIFILISTASYHNHISSFLGTCTSCAFKDLKLTIIVVILPYVCMQLFSKCLLED